MSVTKNKPYKVVYADEHCDRTEGHVDMPEAFQKRYGMEYETWKKGTALFDAGDAFFRIGYISNPQELLRVEVIIGCDGDEIREYFIRQQE